MCVRVCVRGGVSEGGGGGGGDLAAMATGDINPMAHMGVKQTLGLGYRSRYEEDCRRNIIDTL